MKTFLKNSSLGLLRFFVSSFFVATLAACAEKGDDIQPQPSTTGQVYKFTITTDDNWNKNNSTPVAAPSLGHYQLELEGKVASSELWLEATELVGISNGSFLRSQQRQVADETQITRGNPIDNIDEFSTDYGAFGLLGYGFDSSLGIPNMLYNQKVSKEGDEWLLSSTVYWDDDTNVQFYAYAPYNGAGITLSGARVSGAPTINYVTPEQVSNQKDLMIATSEVYSKYPNAPIPLEFRHLLSAIKFKVGADGLREGTIKSITLKGIRYKGTYNAATDAWTLDNALKDFSQTVNFDTHGENSANQAVTTEEQTFLVPPQTLGDEAKAVIEFAYNDQTGNPKTTTLVANLKGRTWRMGNTITYAIESTKVDNDYVFTVEGPADHYTIAGETKQYTITSYKENVKTHTKTPVTWRATEYSVDGGETWTEVPSWFIADSQGGTVMVESHDATMAVHSTDTELKQRNPVSDYDLSTHDYKGETMAETTANSYIVSRPGTYKLPLVYGNARKNGANNTVAYDPQATGRLPRLVDETEGGGTQLNLRTFVNHLDNPITDPYIYNNTGCTPSGAELIWQDQPNLVSNVALSSDGHYLTFKVNAETITLGNAIVAVTDASNKVMWSWHIWVTDKGVYKTYPSYMKNSYFSYITYFGYTSIDQERDWEKEKLMLCMLGQGCIEIEDRHVLVRYVQDESGEEGVIDFYQDGQQSKFPDFTGMPLLYQWGRKDPMLQGNDAETGDHDIYNASRAFQVVSKTDAQSMGVTLGTAIQNPNMLFCGDFEWRSETNNCWADNAWNAVNKKFISNNSNSGSQSVNWVGNTEFEKSVYDPCPVGFHVPDPTYFFYQAQYQSDLRLLGAFVVDSENARGYSNPAYSVTGLRYCHGSYTGGWFKTNALFLWTNIVSYEDPKLTANCGYCGPFIYNTSNGGWGATFASYATNYRKSDAFAILPVSDKDFDR